MGLSSKLVTTDGFDWYQGLLTNGGPDQPRQQKQQQRKSKQQGPPLRCPRCDSTNTKFCYYNNYNRSQPRHFCKACRRHWTNGGTLRNVPVGGGRKPKRPKTTRQPTPANSTDNTDAAAATVDNSHATTTIQQQLLPPLSFVPADVLCQELLRPSLVLPPSDYAHIDNGNNSSSSSVSYLGSLLSLPPVPRFESATTGMMSSYDGSGSYPFSTAYSSPSFFNFTGQGDFAGEDPDAAINGFTATPWQMLPPPSCSNGDTITTTIASSDVSVLDSSSPSGYWGSSCWYDLTGFFSHELQYPPPPQHSQLH